MSQIAFPVAETRVTARTHICCDRCKRELPYDREHFKHLEGWVCCHKLVSNDAHVPQTLPAFTGIEDPPVRIPNFDELHVCPECWRIIEAVVQSAAPATCRTDPTGYCHLPEGHAGVHQMSF